ncbi:unnamed protein product [Tilletia caries]|nr:unnamed protein product [Tilletia caries]
MSNISTVDYNAYPSNLLSSSRMDMLEHMVGTLIADFKKQDEDGKRVFEHRWNPTIFGGGVDITTIPGVVELLEQHRAEFGIIQDPMCLIAKAMSEYGRYCAARLRLETLIETHIKAGLTTALNTSSPGSVVHVLAQPTAEAASAINEDDDESTDSYSSSDSIGDISDESSSSSIASDEWSPCWHAAGIDISPPRRYRYRGLLPTVVGRHFSPMKAVARTTSAIPIEPRPAVNTNAPRYKVVEPNSSASEVENTSFYASEASYDGDDRVDLPTQPTGEEALIIGDIEDELTDSCSCSDSMSIYFTPVDPAAHSTADEHSAFDRTDGESRESCSSSDYMSISFKSFHGAARPTSEDVSTIGDISDEFSDSSSSSISDEWSPCLHAAGINVSPPWRYHYPGLLPTVIGRHFSPMLALARTTSAIPVQATNPAGESRGLESFPSFVIGEIQPRPAAKKNNRVPRFRPQHRTLVPASSSSLAFALDSRLRSPRYLPLRNAPCRPLRLALD